MDFGEVLACRKDDIIRSWMAQVRAGEAIESSQNLAYESVLDSLPSLLDAIAHLLSSAQTQDIQDILESSLVHGALRAQQGYDAEEIVREYALLREIIFVILEDKLLESDALLLLRTTRLIDGSIDKVIAVCFRRYTEERLKEVNLLYDEMIVSNQELDRLVRNEQKNLAHMAHELKSPLSCIIGYSDLFLRQQGNASAPNLRFIEQVLTSGRQLLNMINETLEVSTYRKGQITINSQRIQLCDVIEEVTAIMGTLAQQKGLLVSVLCTPVEMTTDKARLRQVVTNIVSNAVRYTETGSITIVASQPNPAEDLVEISVQDTGLGISEVERAHIFEPFYQGNAGQQLSSSTGLGLAIAHQMVDLLQGSIRLSSTPNVGSTFTITLPLQYKTEMADPLLAEREADNNDPP
ncbi:MAG: sensor histidine kinase [Phormidesmis sp.]